MNLRIGQVMNFNARIHMTKNTAKNEVHTFDADISLPQFLHTLGALGHSSMCS